MFTLLVLPLLLLRLPLFFGPREESSLYTYAWTALVANAFALVIDVLYSILSHHDKRPPAGSHCWRAFRIESVRFSTCEHLLLLSTIVVLSVLRTGVNYGNAVSATVAFIMFANAVRHFYQSVRAGASMAHLRHVDRLSHGERLDLPSRVASRLWLSFVVGVQFFVNIFFAAGFIWNAVFWPLVQSHRMVLLMLVVAGICGLIIVDKYASAELEAREAKLEEAAAATAAAETAEKKSKAT
jgi:hypothetical protein